MTINELQDQQEVRYRLGRAGDGWSTGPSWKPWTTGKLFVNRREHDLPAAQRQRCGYWRAGDILGLTVRDIGWAEYVQTDYQGNGLFVAEDYYLEIEGLV